MSNIVLIAAVAQNRVIGHNGGLPWKFPEYEIFYKQKIRDHVAIMGSKTFESLDQEIPTKFNIVLSQKNKFCQKLMCSKTEIFNNLQFAIDRAKIIEGASTKPEDRKKIFILGGSGIYKKCMKIADEIIITKIDKDFDGDIFFPEIPSSIFKPVYIDRELLAEKPNSFNYRFEYYRRCQTLPS